MEDKERLIKVEEQMRVNTEKIKEHSNAIKELSKTYSLMETMVLRIGNVEKNVESINNKLEKHETRINEEEKRDDKKNGAKWTKLIDYLFYAVLAYALLKIGLK